VEADAAGNEELLTKYNVNSLPTVVLQIGDKVWGTIVGIKIEQELRDWIELHLDVERTYADAGADPGL
jgi:hypothetical protein